MSKYKFSPSERFAVFVTHGEKCYVCNSPLNLKTMEVDHVIPESLAEEADVLRATLEKLGRSPNFEINSFENWMPACGSCNKKKNDTSFEPSLLIQLALQAGAAKAANAAAFAAKSISEKKIANALNVLARANEAGKFDKATIDALQPLIAFQSSHRQPELASEPIRLTPLYEVLAEKDGLRIIRGPYGVGGRPASPHTDASFNCLNCGSNGAWSGARCVVCGEMSDD